MPEFLTSVIIPCYNEEGNIEECIKRIPEFSWNNEIVIVDDGSVDRTAELAKNVRRENLRVVRYEKKPGEGSCCKDRN